MTNTVRIHCINNDEYKEVPIGTKLVDLIDIFGIKMPYLIANAKVNNKTESLDYQIFRPRQVEFVDISDSSAMRTYVRSLCFILAKVVNELLPNAEMYIEHAVSRGYYFQIDSEKPVGDEELNQIRTRMREIVDADLPFVQVEEETSEVVKLFRERGMEAKALLLETSDMIYARYSKLDENPLISKCGL
jgi:uridine kinase